MAWQYLQGENVTHQDSAFLRTAVGVMAGLVLFTAVIMFLANSIVSESSLTEAAKEPMIEQAIRERISPVGQVALAGAAPAAAAPVPAPAAQPAPAPSAPAEQAASSAAGGIDLAKGKQIYSTYCFACHGTGAAGAPKLDDKANWVPRIAQGMDTLYEHALKGFKDVMPPRGTCMTCSDDDIKSAVSYMVGQAKQ